jgi:hypothetical protein
MLARLISSGDSRENFSVPILAHRAFSQSLIMAALFPSLLLPSHHFFLPLTSCLPLKDLCVYIRCTWIIHNSLPISRFLTVSAKSFLPFNIPYSDSGDLDIDIFGCHYSSYHINTVGEQSIDLGWWKYAGKISWDQMVSDLVGALNICFVECMMFLLAYNSCTGGCIVMFTFILRIYLRFSPIIFPLLSSPTA